MIASAKRSRMSLLTGCQTARLRQPVQPPLNRASRSFEGQQVDAAYRSDIREMNELNYARFEAKLEQRLAELTTKIEVTAADLRGEFRSSLEKGLHEQTRFFFLAWAVLLASNIALWFRR